MVAIQYQQVFGLFELLNLKEAQYRAKSKSIE